MNEFQLNYTANEIDERLDNAGNSVLYTEQALTEEQQAQARANIGAAPMSLFKVIEGDSEDVLTSIMPSEDAFTVGKYCNWQSGKITDVASYRCTEDYIDFPVGARMLVHYSKNITTSRYPYVSYYDENKNYIGGDEGPKLEQAEYDGKTCAFYNVPENTHYIRLSLSDGYFADFSAIYLYAVTSEKEVVGVEIPGLIIPENPADSSVRYTEQTLMPEQQKQARDNIGAFGIDEFEKLGFELEEADGSFTPVNILDGLTLTETVGCFWLSDGTVGATQHTADYTAINEKIDVIAGHTYLIKQFTGTLRPFYQDGTVGAYVDMVTDSVTKDREWVVPDGVIQIGVSYSHNKCEFTEMYRMTPTEEEKTFCTTSDTLVVKPVNLQSAETQEYIKGLMSRNSSSVLTTEQELSKEQQAQARENIDAVSAELFEVIDNGMVDELTNILPPADVFTEGKFCSHTSGNIVDNSSYSCVEEYIPFPTGARLFAYYSASSASAHYPVVSCYDENKTFVGGEVGANLVQETYSDKLGVFYNVPENTRYIRVSLPTGSISKYFDFIFLYTVVEKEAQDSVKIPGLILPKSKIDGENVVFFGDSIMGMYRDDTSVANQFAKMTGANVYNVGFGGCRMSVHSLTGYAEFSMWALADAIYNEDWSAQEAGAPSGSAYFPDQVEVLKSIDFSTIDRVVIHYGTNDFTGNAQIDNAENPLDYNTLCGALRYSFEKLLTKYPHLRIYVSLPTFRYWASDAEVYPDTHTNRNGDTLLDFIDALANTAKEYNIPVIDGFHRLGVNKLNVTTFLEDGTHHNATGRMRLGHYIASCICKEV